MLFGDWPHHIPLQNMTAVLLSEKSISSSFDLTLNTPSMISAIEIGSAPLAGLSFVQGTFIALGIVPLPTQSGVRESTSTMVSSPSLMLFAYRMISDSPMVSTPGASFEG